MKVWLAEGDPPQLVSCTVDKVTIETVLEDVTDWVTTWLPLMWNGERPLFKDAHWEWATYMALAVKDPGTLSVWKLASEAGDLEGLLFTRTGRTDSEKRPIVYVDRVCKAPWNRPPASRYGYVGSVLLAAAIVESRDRGYGGAIGLHATPLPATLEFYRAIPMRAVPALDKRETEGDEARLHWFELAAEDATRFLESLRSRKLLE